MYVCMQYTYKCMHTSCNDTGRALQLLKVKCFKVVSSRLSNSESLVLSQVCVPMYVHCVRHPHTYVHDDELDNPLNSLICHISQNSLHRDCFALQSLLCYNCCTFGCSHSTDTIFDNVNAEKDKVAKKELQKFTKAGIRMFCV